MATSERTGIAYDRHGTGEPLVLLHGTGGSRAHWQPLIERLEARRDVLVPDLPGHGASAPPPDGTPHTPVGYAQVLAELLDELGIDTAHVAGNSVGGWTALELAKLGRARSVVALAPAGLWARRDPWRCVAQLRGQYVMGRLFAPLTPHVMRSELGRTLLLRGTMAHPRRISAEAATEMASTFASTPTFREHLSQTRRARFAGGDGIDPSVPVTVAWGDQERLIPAKARLRDELPEHARVLTLPGCGHAPMWDDPELVATTILEGAAAQARQEEPLSG
jgi:pimeloyl-ACP methyl ester carboxylesterase